MGRRRHDGRIDFCQIVRLRQGQHRPLARQMRGRIPRNLTQTRQLHGTCATGHGDAVFTCRQHRARIARARRLFRLMHQHAAPAGAEFRCAKRVPVGPVIERLDEPHDLRRRFREIQPPSPARPIGTGIDMATFRGLDRPFGLATLQQPRHLGERVDRLRITLGVQRQRGIFKTHLEPPLHQHIAFINTGGDPMPGDAMLGLTIQQRPDRRIQPRVLRQRPVMEIHRAHGGQSQHVLGDQ